MPEIIPHEIKSFLLANIDSISQLEALLLLRASKGDTFDTDHIARRLYISPEDAAAVLAKLVQRGLLKMADTQPAAFCYAPDDQNLERLVDWLASLYAKYLIPVTNFIHQKPRRNIQDFADAFKLKRDKD